MSKCRHKRSCPYYCVHTESCDYLLITGNRRPVPAEECKGYRKQRGRKVTGIVLEGSKFFGAEKE